MNQAIFNPWASPLLNGFNQETDDGCDAYEAAYVWPETNGFQVMTANEERRETIVLDHDADFRFECFQWALESIDEGTTPGFLYRIQDDAGNFISDGFVYCFCTPGTFANPWPQFPHVTYAVHQRIQFEVTNLASHAQGVQVVFRGSKRVRRAA